DHAAVETTGHPPLHDPPGTVVLAGSRAAGGAVPTRYHGYTPNRIKRHRGVLPWKGSLRVEQSPTRKVPTPQISVEIAHLDVVPVGTAVGQDSVAHFVVSDRGVAVVDWPEAVSIMPCPIEVAFPQSTVASDS